MNPRSLSFRLIAWYAGWLTGVFFLLGALMYFDLKHFLENNLRESQARRAQQIADTLLARVNSAGEDYVVSEVKDRYEPEVNDRFIRITRANGSVLYLSGPPKDQSFDASSLPALASSARQEFSQKVGLPGAKTLLIAALNYQTPDGRRYLVEVGTPLDPVADMLNHLFLQLALGLPFAVVVVVVGGRLLVKRALKPVEQAARKAELISQHNLSERLPLLHTGDELERLSISLNHMISRLEDAIQNSKRFVADASHELRTPLTVLRAELENFIQDGRFDPETCATFGSMLEEVERLAKIVDGLFALSRLDAGEAQAELVQFDLSELAATTADQMSLLAKDKDISLTSNFAGKVMVAGDRARLKQVVVNLLDNAIKYTPAGGTLKLNVAAHAGEAVCEVADNGIGIPADAMPHVFDRFFRVDQARSRDLGGAGIGLSIVKAICVAHGGRVEVESATGGGSCFRVKLPLADEKNSELLHEN